MFRARKYRRQVAESLTEAVREIYARVDGSAADDRARVLLRTSAQTQAETLQRFAEYLRRNGAVPPFVSAMQLSDSAYRALRVAMWALVLCVPRSQLGRRYPRAVDIAIPALGVENEWEHRLVYFEPTAVEEAQNFQFDRWTLEGMIAAATGIDDDSSFPWLVVWTTELNGGLGVLMAAMDVVDPPAPQPGFSRLSEVEAEIKARQEPESGPQ